MLLLLETLATLSAGLFAGAAIYVSLVEHPARTLCGSVLAITEFGPSYKKGAIMQSALAVLGTICGLAAWLSGASIAWLDGALLLGALIPFTVLVIFPTNKQLLDPTLDKGSPLAGELLRRWGYLHAVRSLLGLAAFLIFLAAGFYR